MNEPKKRGRKSVFDESLGNGVMKKPRLPIPVWEILESTKTKKLLNKMALDDSVKQKAWELGE